MEISDTSYQFAIHPPYLSISIAKSRTQKKVWKCEGINKSHSIRQKLSTQPFDMVVNHGHKRTILDQSSFNVKIIISINIFIRY